MPRVGNCWQILAIFGNLWQLFATFCNFLHLLASFWDFWDLLATLSIFRHLLETSGILRHLLSSCSHVIMSTMSRCQHGHMSPSHHVPMSLWPSWLCDGMASHWSDSFWLTILVLAMANLKKNQNSLPLKETNASP